jgi:hypothetical protein
MILDPDKNDLWHHTAMPHTHSSTDLIHSIGHCHGKSRLKIFLVSRSSKTHHQTLKDGKHQIYKGEIADLPYVYNLLKMHSKAKEKPNEQTKNEAQQRMTMFSQSSSSNHNNDYQRKEYDGKNLKNVVEVEE